MLEKGNYVLRKGLYREHTLRTYSHIAKECQLSQIRALGMVPPRSGTGSWPAFFTLPAKSLISVHAPLPQNGPLSLAGDRVLLSECRNGFNKSFIYCH